MGDGTWNQQSSIDAIGSEAAKICPIQKEAIEKMEKALERMRDGRYHTDCAVCGDEMAVTDGVKNMFGDVVHPSCKNRESGAETGEGGE